MARQEFGVSIRATATAAGAATATVTGVTGKIYYITDVSGSSDLAGAILQIKDGSTVIWQDRIGNGATAVYNFSRPLTVTAGNDAVVTVTGTSYGAANITGFSLPNS